MVAKMSLNWKQIEFPGDSVHNWTDLKKLCDTSELSALERSVYVIRIGRPFSFQYPNGYSPVAYIGKGKAQQRITSHIKGWITNLSKRVPSLKISIWYCEPRVKYHGDNCEEIKADLMQRFTSKYGSLPLRNRQSQWNNYEYSYGEGDLKVLHPGKGSGYHWALTPLPNSHFYRLK